MARIRNNVLVIKQGLDSLGTSSGKATNAIAKGDKVGLSRGITHCNHTIPGGYDYNYIKTVVVNNVAYHCCINNSGFKMLSTTTESTTLLVSQIISNFHARITGLVYHNGFIYIMVNKKLYKYSISDNTIVDITPSILTEATTFDSCMEIHNGLLYIAISRTAEPYMKLYSLLDGGTVSLIVSSTSADNLFANAHISIAKRLLSDGQVALTPRTDLFISLFINSTNLAFYMYEIENNILTKSSAPAFDTTMAEITNVDIIPDYTYCNLHYTDNSQLASIGGVYMNIILHGGVLGSGGISSQEIPCSNVSSATPIDFMSPTPFSSITYSTNVCEYKNKTIVLFNGACDNTTFFQVMDIANNFISLKDIEMSARFKTLGVTYTAPSTIFVLNDILYIISRFKENAVTGIDVFKVGLNSSKDEECYVCPESELYYYKVDEIGVAKNSASQNETVSIDIYYKV